MRILWGDTHIQSTQGSGWERTRPPRAGGHVWERKTCKSFGNLCPGNGPNTAAGTAGNVRNSGAVQMPITKGLIKFAICSAQRAFLSRALACKRLTKKGVCQREEAIALALSVNHRQPLKPQARSGDATARRRSPHAPDPIPACGRGAPFFFFF